MTILNFSEFFHIVLQVEMGTGFLNERNVREKNERSFRKMKKILFKKRAQKKYKRFKIVRTILIVHEQ